VSDSPSAALPVPTSRAASGVGLLRAHWPLVLVASVYLLAFPYHPGLRSPNELCRLWQTRSLVEYGTLHINPALRDHGYVGDLSVKEGRYYPSKAPLLSFAAVPLYKVLSWVGGGHRYAVPEVPLVFWSRLLLTALPTLLMLLAVRRFLLAYLSPPLAEALVVTYALGSLALSYSLLFMSHQTTAVLLFGSFYALWRCARGEWGERGYLVAGACAGATLAAEYTGGLGVVGLVLYAGLTHLLRPLPLPARLTSLARSAALATLGALPFVLALMAYHQAAFGHPLHSGYKYLADAAYQPWHLGGFLGIRTPDPRALVLSYFSPLRGLFTLAPFLLLALPGVLLLRRDGPQARALFLFTLALLAAYTYFTSSFSYESWGWTTGPRHLTGLVPFLLLPVGLTLERLLSRGPALLGGAAVGLCAASILVTGALSMVNYVPDDVSSALFGLVLPLWRNGFLPPTLPGLLGVPSGLAGAGVLVCLVAAAVAVVVRLGRGVGHALGAAASVALVLGLLALATQHSGADRAAVKHMESLWLTPPGKVVPFWPQAR
jgi:hypothetical protein